MHVPAIARLFFPSIVDSRILRVEPSLREYIGYSHALQGRFHMDFKFMHFSGPSLLMKDNAIDDNHLKAYISQVNRLRPRYVDINHLIIRSSFDLFNYSILCEIFFFKRYNGCNYYFPYFLLWLILFWILVDPVMHISIFVIDLVSLSLFLLYILCLSKTLSIYISIHIHNTILCIPIYIYIYR